MENQLLSSKIRIPVAPQGLVSRPRLLARLDDSLQQRLILISASPGSGKSSLLSEWLHQQSCPCAWVSLENDENDPALFLAYLTASLDQIFPGLDLQKIKLPHLLESHPLDKTITALINELEKVEQPFILALDDYHVIQEPDIHRAMTNLLEHKPALMHIVISTRVDPPLPIALMRGRGQLAEFRLKDLRFTHSEVNAFLQKTLQIELPAPDIKALESRTEGWAAGLQLASVSLQGSSDPSRFIQAFSGSNRFVLDYLIEEVLQRQSETIQTFLLQTSILDRFCASLCTEVTGINETQTIIEILEHSNLFIIPLDDSRNWYRYHHLFADLLNQRLNQKIPDLSDLNRRASGWYEKNGFIAEAIDHGLLAHHYSQVAVLIEKYAETYILKDQSATLKKWYELFPLHELQGYPEICMNYVWILTLYGDIHKGQQVLEILAEKIEKDHHHSPGLESEINIARSVLMIYEGHFNQAIDTIQESYKRLPSYKTLARGIALWVIDLMSQIQMTPKSGNNQLLEGDNLPADNHHNALLYNLTQYTLGMMQTMKGSLKEANRTFLAVFDRMGEDKDEILLKDNQDLPPSISLILGGYGEVLREFNDLAGAEKNLVKAIELGQIFNNGEFLADMHISLGKTYAGCGRYTEAENALREGLNLANRTMISPFTTLQTEAWLAWVWCFERRYEEAEKWLKSPHHDFGLDKNDFVIVYWDSLIALVSGKVLSAKGLYQDAIKLLKESADNLNHYGWLNIFIQLNLQMASCYSRLGEDDKALETIDKVLKVAEPQGMLRSFLDGASDLQTLLLRYDRKFSPSGIIGNYLHRILAAFETQPDNRDSSQNLVEPLSERELEVLNYLAAGLSNREIAERIVTAVSTVKSHTNAIYRKLGISTRTQAIARARELKII